MLNTMRNIKLILAPMQGVLDPLMRDVLTRVNCYDLCVSEFVRVVEQRLPAKAFYRLCPELKNQGYTASGTPVRVQLLGQSPQYLAENAALAVRLGSHGIDLNCGCPSKTVNGNCGGASLLKDPELIYRATLAIRQALGASHCVSVKVRLGWDSSAYAFEIADAVACGGADEIAVHGRTKRDGYRAEKIDWAKIGEIQQRLRIPVIANGEIWNREDAVRCLEMTGSSHLMVARGALNMPNLSYVIKHGAPMATWHEVVSLLVNYIDLESPNTTALYHIARIKQWLHYLKVRYHQAYDLFEMIKPIMDSQQLKSAVQTYARGERNGAI
ncbi:tRNA dihydrouridine(16) synthase DusC [Spirabiliibacterium falconis]|uniref:tRNA dihydrouridine(16) synthase DusC n=1 Tax=Spirabiliibacterium falconis TaxID=572023 RepID=UPI001AAD7315|nr:tRNA dihydrouridine(16) synthase DusC [Spirabiliibacterium falconis]MBE2893488.1 tRNA dihydrouridine(16) synthase DusC [Spirabiliibacterium falconis]